MNLDALADPFNLVGSQGEAYSTGSLFPGKNCPVVLDRNRGGRTATGCSRTSERKPCPSRVRFQ